MDKTIEDLQKATKELTKASWKDQKKFDSMRKLLENTDGLSTSIIEKGDSKTLVVAAEAMGLYLMKRGITSSQLRNIFGYAKRIDEDVKNMSEPLSSDVVHKLLLLSPKLAYVAGRETNRDKKETLELLREFFDKCVEKIGTDATKFKRFIDLFESILSYHKFYGAK